MKRRTVFGIGIAILLIVAVALPASAIGPWRVSQADDSDGNYPGCGSYRHQNSGGQPDACNCDRVRLRLADGSCGDTYPGYAGCGQYRHQNDSNQPDDHARDGGRDRMRLADGSCGNCPRR